MLKHRLLTAAILIPVLLWCLFGGSPALFLAIATLVEILAALEWAKLIGLPGRLLQVSYALAHLLILGVLFHILKAHDLVFAILVLSSLTWMSSLAILMLYARGRVDICKGKVLRAVLGFGILIPFWVGMNVLRAIPSGEIYLLILLLFVWGADTGAYFAGRIWGRTPLARSISPKKTREGCYGAFITCLLVALVSGWLLHFNTIELIFFACVSIITAFFSILGDLFESMIKRQEDVKDSGNLLPGHGGLLDRIDSLLAATPVYVLGLLLFLSQRS